MSNLPDWTKRPPNLYSIVTGFFPEKKPEDGKCKCRPLLVTQVLQSKTSGDVALRVAYGTSKTVKSMPPKWQLQVHNSSHLDACGLLTPTTFIIDPTQQKVVLWNRSNFCLWSNQRHPKRGSLPEDLQREYAWLMTEFLKT